MEVKNFAAFGLFADGKLIISDTMEELIKEAKKFCEKTGENCIIAKMIFKNDEIKEDKPILLFTVINNVIYITR